MMTDKVGEPQQRGVDFERRVASIYRALGADVQHNAALAGNQIDVLVRERTSTGTFLTKAVECKAHTRPVGVQVVNAFAALALLLRQRGLIDKSEIVSSAGFTAAARDSAKAIDVELTEIADLEQRVSTPNLLVLATEAVTVQDQVAARQPRPKHLFVVMPFSAEFNDVYILGIRETAEQLGFVVERADEVEHIQAIIDIIREKIRTCDAVIADTTYRNPNVFYEIGYADGINRPVVLICRETETIPFDLQGVNSIKYGSIVDLRERLERRLKALFS